MKAYRASLTISSAERTEITDITKAVRNALQLSNLRTGIALVNSMHTTCALFVNEYQAALIGDLKTLVTALVPDRGGYRHDDARYSDCERGNGAAHLRAALFGRSVALGVSDGELVLGRFQSIIFAEFDGPRHRDIAVQLLGE
ncbi:MAG TPA: secondary thiamine-phosphate synthase enzyme YjbQ [Candidatus Limnocylindria bacterium]|nr:secondary thiamine-phosphate synthase enzyme YjbQ [Candidatus Limnocylindria bacterium]